jgi:hypothetical protein
MEDMGQYAQARKTVFYALDRAPTIFPLYQSLLQAEAVYLDSILGTDADRAHTYYNKLERIPALKNLISFHRASYAYFLLQKKNPERAHKALLDLQKKIKHAPFQAEAAFESNQLSYIQQLNNP